MSMGVNEMFCEQAKFWSMFENMYQKSYLTLDKEGVEVAAATVVVGDTSPGIINDVVMEFNRPYIFFIVENSTKTVLFEGSIVK